MISRVVREQRTGGGRGGCSSAGWGAGVGVKGCNGARGGGYRFYESVRVSK